MWNAARPAQADVRTVECKMAFLTWYTAPVAPLHRIACERSSRTPLSLPTYRERRYLYENCVARGKGQSARYVSVDAFNLRVWALCPRMRTDNLRAETFDEAQVLDGEEENAEDYNMDAKDERLSEEAVLAVVPEWAYLVHVRSPKASMGKRAVVRNRAKRRIRAAASQVMPLHAKRGFEYTFNACPGALTISSSELQYQVEYSLRTLGCWGDDLKYEQLRRPLYCKHATAVMDHVFVEATP